MLNLMHGFVLLFNLIGIVVFYCFFQQVSRFDRVSGNVAEHVVVIITFSCHFSPLRENLDEHSGHHVTQQATTRKG